MIYTYNAGGGGTRRLRVGTLLLQPHVRLVDGGAGALAEHAADAAVTKGTDGSVG